MSDVDPPKRMNRLPLLKTTKPAERLELFARKLHACCSCYDNTGDDGDDKNQELKCLYLQEVVDHLDTSPGVLSSEPIYALSVVMISRNLFRTFPPKDPDYDPEEDEAYMDPSWGHLYLVYQYFLHFLESSDFQPSVAKKYMDQKFITRLLYTFASEDGRERQILKTILHRVYGKFLGLRACIRRQINNIFLTFMYENVDFSGVPEILEILGSVINGYVYPLKPEHMQFLNKILIPLHSHADFGNFQPQLVYCIVQYIEKDSSTTSAIIKGLMKFWPKSCSAKEVLFLGELEELIDIMPPPEFKKIQDILLKKLSQCTESQHFQVAERALFFWDNDYISSLIEVNAASAYPLVLGSLKSVNGRHWNSSISTLASTTMQRLEEMNKTEYYSVMGTPEVKTKAKTKRKSLWRRAAEMTMRS